MAYSKLRDVLHLATELQASSIGLTIEEMMDRTERTRSTVERMLAALTELGLEPELSRLEEDHHLTKRWKLYGGLSSEVLALDEPERMALDRHLHTLPDGPEAKALTKLLAGQKPLSPHLAVDQAELIDRTFYVGSVGPKISVSEILMRRLEKAIQGFEKLELLYHAAGATKASWRTVEPLGLLFSRFDYLVARMRGSPVTFRLDLILRAKPTGKYFQAANRDAFKIWANESFGVYHGDKAIDVKLRFTGEAARRARNVVFHPSQRMRQGRGKSLILEMKCRGHWELIHEICHPDWLGNVEIEKPQALKDEYQAYLTVLEKALGSP